MPSDVTGLRRESTNDQTSIIPGSFLTLALYPKIRATLTLLNEASFHTIYIYNPNHIFRQMSQVRSSDEDLVFK